MLGLFESLVYRGIAVACLIAGAVVVAFTLFVGVTLSVTLFHPDAIRRGAAAGVLRDLLALFSVKGPGK